MKTVQARERFPILYNSDDYIVNVAAQADSRRHATKDKPIRFVNNDTVPNSFSPPSPTGYIKCRKHEHF